jgi:hypothetical protein
MSDPGSTLLLDTATWDLTVDASGNIALATTPYALAQDVASAVRVFLGEEYYDTSVGVPYLQQILGELPSLGYLKAQIEQAALSVPGVVTATAFITGLSNRTVAGQVQVTDSTGFVQTVAL